ANLMKELGLSKMKAGQEVDLELDTEQDVRNVRESPAKEPSENQGMSPEDAFVEARKKFRRKVNKSLGTLGPRAREWAGLVRREGGEVIVQAIGIWAQENVDFLKNDSTFPLGHFLKNSAEFIEAAKIANEPED